MTSKAPSARRGLCVVFSDSMFLMRLDTTLSIFVIMIFPAFLALLIAFWAGKHFQVLVFRHVARRSLATLGAVSLYLIVFLITDLFLSQLGVGIVEAVSNNNEGLGLLVFLEKIKYIPIVLILWISGVVLLVRRTRSLLSDGKYHYQWRWWLYVPLLLFFSLFAAFCSWMFLII